VLTVKGFPDPIRRRRLCIPAAEPATRDPVCGISVPADLAVLAEAADGVGFCSASCADAWGGVSATG
jgi:hypothetical protein